MGIVDQELANTWVIYWPPAGPGPDGQETAGSPQAFRANWMSGQTRSLTSDGETYNITETVMASLEMKPGGFLLRVPDPLVYTSGVVLAAHVSDAIPRTGQIRGVTVQNFFDDPSDNVYKASI